MACGLWAVRMKAGSGKNMVPKMISVVCMDQVVHCQKMPNIATADGSVCLCL